MAVRGSLICLLSWFSLTLKTPPPLVHPQCGSRRKSHQELPATVLKACCRLRARWSHWAETGRTKQEGISSSAAKSAESRAEDPSQAREPWVKEDAVHPPT